MVKALLLFFVVAGCTGSGAPAEWTEWRTGLQDRYKEKFSSPSIVHHVYLENDGEEAYITKTEKGYRWSKAECSDCVAKVQRMPGLNLKITNIKDGRSIDVEKEKETSVEDLDKVYIKYYGYEKDNKVRAFIHDLKQHKLEKKRRRTFFSYSKNEIMSGKFKWVAKPEKVTISRSDGSSKEMNVIAKISYNHKSKDGELSVYDYGSLGDEYKKQSKIMMLYRDYSNGKKTYGAGRFLLVDLKKELNQLKDGDAVTVDLNYSYNPPCAVSTGFHCPLPQDTIALEVFAGEEYNK